MAVEGLLRRLPLTPFGQPILAATTQVAKVTAGSDLTDVVLRGGRTIPLRWSRSADVALPHHRLKGIALTDSQYSCFTVMIWSVSGGHDEKQVGYFISFSAGFHNCCLCFQCYNEGDQ